ncbi:hypothetical protein NBRC116586_26250 [Pseudooceanicola nitratireducens]|uniref:hypothetical protein n=1 Tax=Pseudooceanicola nitratireducens TaxID=517719 RepID=UPI00310AFB2A
MFKRIAAFSLACIPGLLPDALTLASEWSYVGTAVTGGLLAIISLTIGKSHDEKDPAYRDLMASLTVAFLLSGAFSIYRYGSGMTATAQALPDLAQTLAETVGTEQRLQTIQAEFTTRLTALERIATLESQLATQERQKQSLERDLAQSERDAQAQERQLQTIERALAEAERKTQQAQRELVQRAIETEQAELERARAEELALFAPGVITKIRAEATVPGYLGRDEHQKIAYWRAQRPDTHILTSAPLEMLLYAGRRRDIQIIAALFRPEGTLIWAQKMELPKSDWRPSPGVGYEASVTSSIVQLRADQLATGDVIQCISMFDSETREKWDLSEVLYYELRQRKVKYGDDVINVLPDYWKPQHSSDKTRYRQHLAQYCSF